MNIPSPAAQEWTWLGLNADNWIAIGSCIVAIVGVGTAVIYARRSAKASANSAKSAEKSAEEAATISQIERDRRHDDLAPPHPGEIKAEEEPDARLGRGHYTAFGSITVPRDYRVKAEAWNGTALTPIDLPLLLRANQPQRFFIDRTSNGKSNVTEIRFQFWPPVPNLDDTDAWACPCARPTGDGATGRGHWELRVPVAYMPEIQVW